jgi:hypothetical protein
MTETCKYLGIPGCAIVHVDTEPKTATHLCRALSALRIKQPHQQLSNTENHRKRAAGSIWKESQGSASMWEYLDAPEYTHRNSECLLHVQIRQGGEPQKDSCKHLERLEPTKHKQTQNLCLLPACTALQLMHLQPSESANLPG